MGSSVMTHNFTATIKIACSFTPKLDHDGISTFTSGMKSRYREMPLKISGIFGLVWVEKSKSSNDQSQALT